MNTLYKMVLFSVFLCLPSYIFSSNEIFLTEIKGKDSQLKRPEGIAFSPSGDCIAVTNSEGNSITIYERNGASGAEYSSTPSCVIMDPVHLKYVHDVKFSPCGQFIAAASREANAVVLYKRNGSEGSSFELEPYCILNGRKSLIKNPSSLEFSPCGKVLIVCNRYNGGGITFHKRELTDNGRYESVPFYQITEEQMLEYGASASHGISFCPDGKHFVVVHKKFYKNAHASGESALIVYNFPDLSEGDFLPYPNSISFYGSLCLHSVSVHPTKPLVMTVNEKVGVTLYSLDPAMHECSPFRNINVSADIKSKAPAKGGTFSSDGLYFAVTTEEPSVLIYRLQD